MNVGVFFIGLIILIVGIIYLLPVLGMYLIPISLPSFGIDPMMLGGGLTGLGLILLIAGVKMD